ncbi:MAG: hydrolase [Clostridiales bacterium]|nr:hydrolase [Clostridiales bacterium]
MKNMIEREAALNLLKKYNKDSFHLRHALTVEHMMRWYAAEEGYKDEQDFWGLVGLLHDVDFGMWPEEHCRKAPELLREIEAPDNMVRAICAHGYAMFEGLPKPEHQMEKVLFAADELTGLIYAATLMRPSKSAGDMELKSLKKKFKDKAFAAGCSRDIIASGAELLDWPLDTLLEKTLKAMQAGEDEIEAEYAKIIL